MGNLLVCYTYPEPQPWKLLSFLPMVFAGLISELQGFDIPGVGEDIEDIIDTILGILSVGGTGLIEALFFPDCDEVLEDMAADGGRMCARNLDELACLVEEVAENTSAPSMTPSMAPTGKGKGKGGKGKGKGVIEEAEVCNQIEVCSGAELFFETPQVEKIITLLKSNILTFLLANRFEDEIRDILGFIRSGATLEIPDNTEIVCEGGCDCTLKRPFLSLFYSLCPFFTTQLGNDFALSGFQFMSDGVMSQENIISFSNYEQVDLSMSDITLTSEIEESMCAAPDGECALLPVEGEECTTGKGMKRRGMRKLGETRGSSSSYNKKSSARTKNSGIAPIPGATRNNKVERFLTPDLCSTSNELVQEFIRDDTDNDGVITCDEAKAATMRELPNFPIEYFRCGLLFDELVAKPEGCFILTDAGLELSGVTIV